MSEKKSRHNLLVISGPSGTGKSTLIHMLLEEFPQLNFSVSHTTRPRRANEIDGRDYHFISARQFERMIDRGDFAEWADVHGHRYGTSWREIRAKSSGQRILVLDLDVQGARSIKREFPEALMVFIVPPSLADLRQRLLKRGQPPDAEFDRRLKTAIKELRQASRYDLLIVNESLEPAYGILRCLLVTYRQRPLFQQKAIDRLLKGVT